MSDLFRKEALSKYLRVDAPGALITIAPPSTLVVFGAMALVLVALGALVTVGRAQMTSEGRGIVKPDAPPVTLHAPFSGTVLSVARAAHDEGHAGELLVAMDARREAVAHDRCTADLGMAQRALDGFTRQLDEWNDRASHDRDAATALVLIAQIRADRERVASVTQRCEALASVVDRSRIVFPVDAVVTDVAVSAGAQVHEGDVLATLYPSSARLVGYLALGEQYRADLAVGLPVRVKFDALPYDEVGAGTARVTRILDELPSGAKIEAAPGAGVFAELSLDAMPGGAPARSGMTFTGDVLTRRTRVLSLVFGGPSDAP